MTLKIFPGISVEEALEGKETRQVPFATGRVLTYEVNGPLLMATPAHPSPFIKLQERFTHTSDFFEGTAEVTDPAWLGIETVATRGTTMPTSRGGWFFTWWLDPVTSTLLYARSYTKFPDDKTNFIKLAEAVLGLGWGIDEAKCVPHTVVLRNAYDEVGVAGGWKP